MDTCTRVRIVLISKKQANTECSKGLAPCMGGLCYVCSYTVFVFMFTMNFMTIMHISHIFYEGYHTVYLLTPKSLTLSIVSFIIYNEKTDNTFGNKKDARDI